MFGQNVVGAGGPSPLQSQTAAALGPPTVLGCCLLPWLVLLGPAILLGQAPYHSRIILAGQKTSLYDKLKLALASARDIAILEAQRQKWHYDRKAGAVELHLGDKLLVKLDTFRGQWQKLKNQWGDALYTVVKYMADRIPAYEVENDVNKKRQVLHWA